VTAYDRCDCNAIVAMLMSTYSQTITFSGQSGTIYGENWQLDLKSNAKKESK
jgi:hypothetical protein